MRRTTASCWKSFSPKYALHGPTMANSLATTVATPSKCVGPARALEHLGERTRRPTRSSRVPPPYISSTDGANT